ncbi:hypothetical protein M0802_005288 [Mischocyttarus mexicanus]|nr:hypothetical protein M0802_005288 [Mischocyttarus mexicanus]
MGRRGRPFADGAGGSGGNRGGGGIGAKAMEGELRSSWESREPKWPHGKKTLTVYLDVFKEEKSAALAQPPVVDRFKNTSDARAAGDGPLGKKEEDVVIGVFTEMAVDLELGLWHGEGPDNHQYVRDEVHRAIN